MREEDLSEVRITRYLDQTLTFPRLLGWTGVAVGQSPSVGAPLISFAGSCVAWLRGKREKGDEALRSKNLCDRSAALFELRNGTGL